MSGARLQRKKINPPLIRQFRATAGVVSYPVEVSSGSFIFSGQSVGVSVVRQAVVSAGAFVFTGQAVTVGIVRASAAAAAGSFTFTASSVSVGVVRQAGISAGAFVFSPSSVNVSRSLLISVSPAAFSFAGSAVALSFIREAIITAGAYEFTTGVGEDVSVVIDVDEYPVEVTAGVFVFTPGGVFMPRLDPEELLLKSFMIRQLLLESEIATLLDPPGEMVTAITRRSRMYDPPLVHSSFIDSSLVLSSTMADAADLNSEIVPIIEARSRII